MRAVDTLSDRRRDIMVTIIIVGSVGTCLVFVSLTQSYFLVDHTAPAANLQGSLPTRLIASLTPAWLGGLLMGLIVGGVRRAPVNDVLVCLVIAVGMAILRVVLQAVLSIYRVMDCDTLTVEISAGLMAGLLCCFFAYLSVSYDRRLRDTYRGATRERERTVNAIEALRAEEGRVHQIVSEGLHGNLQQRFVLLESRVDNITNQIEKSCENPAVLRNLKLLKRELMETRNDSVRATSRLLSPDGLDVGLVPAIRIMLGRLPAHVGYSLNVDDQIRLWDDPEFPRFSSTQRLIAVRFIQECVTNALKHGGARNIDVSVASELTDSPVSAEAIRIRVENDGSDLAGDLRLGSGLDRLRKRLELANGRLVLSARPGGGTVAEMYLSLAAESDELT